MLRTTACHRVLEPGRGPALVCTVEVDAVRDEFVDGIGLIHAEQDLLEGKYLVRLVAI